MTPRTTPKDTAPVVTKMPEALSFPAAEDSEAIELRSRLLKMILDNEQIRNSHVPTAAVRR